MPALRRAPRRHRASLPVTSQRATARQELAQYGTASATPGGTHAVPPCGAHLPQRHLSSENHAAASATHKPRAFARRPNVAGVLPPKRRPPRSHLNAVNKTCEVAFHHRVSLHGAKRHARRPTAIARCHRRALLSPRATSLHGMSPLPRHVTTAPCYRHATLLPGTLPLPRATSLLRVAAIAPRYCTTRRPVTSRRRGV